MTITRRILADARRASEVQIQTSRGVPQSVYIYGPLSPTSEYRDGYVLDINDALAPRVLAIATEFQILTVHETDPERPAVHPGGTPIPAE